MGRCVKEVRMKRLVPIEKVKYTLPKGIMILVYILLGIVLVAAAGTLAYWFLARITEGAFVNDVVRVALSFVA